MIVVCVLSPKDTSRGLRRVVLSLSKDTSLGFDGLRAHLEVPDEDLDQEWDRDQCHGFCYR